MKKTVRRIAATAVASGIVAAGAVGLAGAASASTVSASQATSYRFETLNNNNDPTFNQLLGINDFGVIAGYFGSGAAGHPNKGYLLGAPYDQAGYTSENFPGSAQTQVTGLNDLGDTSGFWVNGAGTNKGFVEWNGVFSSYTDPNT